MELIDHRLRGADVASAPSPNDGGPLADGVADTVILHYTALDTVEHAVEVLSDPTPGRRVSAHVVVGRDGGVTQLLPFDRVAWHAGRSAWGGREGFNGFSLGIEIDNVGWLTPQDGTLVSWQGTPVAAEEAVQRRHRNETEARWWQRYPNVQVDAVEALCRLLVAAYPIGWILGHDEIAPDRKQDPGPAFPLDELRQRLLPGPMAAYDR